MCEGAQKDSLQTDPLFLNIRAGLFLCLTTLDVLGGLHVKIQLSHHYSLTCSSIRCFLKL